MNILMKECGWCKCKYPQDTAKYFNIKYNLDFCGAICSNDAHFYNYNIESKQAQSKDNNGSCTSSK